MALVLTNVGTAQTPAGGSSLGGPTQASVTGTNGGLMILRGFYNATNGLGVAPTMSVDGTWSGTWTRRAVCTRGDTSGYHELVEIWTSPISGSPSGTVIYNDNAGGWTDGWAGFQLDFVTGQDASPIGLAASPSPLTSTSTFATDLGGVPAASSFVLGVIHDDNQVGPGVVEPSGWSEEQELSPAWGAITEWAYINGGSVQSPSWSGFTNSGTVRILGAALEIIAAAGGAPTIDTQPQPVTVYQGQAAVFTISATTSGGSLSYQWKQGVTNVGTNSSTLTITPTTMADNGTSITCDVTDSNGTTTSAAVLLTVIPTAKLAWLKA